MKSHTTEQFRKLLGLLPMQTRQQAREAYRLFRQNPSHPSLRFKKIHATQPIYSARVNKDCRVVGVMKGDVIVWYWIGPHHEYDKLLKQF